MKILTGKVTANKTAGMATVEVARLVSHPMYHKRVKKTKLYHALVTGKQKEIGAMVKIAECRPISKTIKWKVIEDNKNHAAA